MIRRKLQDIIEKQYHKGKAIIVLGPRQVGKTTLIQQSLQGKECVFLNGDDPDVRELLRNAGKSRLEAIIGTRQWVFIDEAQRIENIGLLGKMIMDQIKGVQLIISGSSALEINDITQEPMTGRKFEHLLYPISYIEFEDHVGYIEATAQLEERIVYGMYPDVINNRHNAHEALRNLTSSYLYKDVLSFAGIKKPDLLDRLLRAIALQLGSEVSYNELGQLLGVDKSTVSRYIDLLEKTFVLFRVPSFSRNLRNEIKQNRKIYFYDNGIRNAIINNLNPLSLRDDKGALWENYLISERMKALAYERQSANCYFWRTVQGQEIDYVEERTGELSAFEFKWRSRDKRKRPPSSFMNSYSATYRIIDKENFRDFLKLETNNE